MDAVSGLKKPISINQKWIKYFIRYQGLKYFEKTVPTEVMP